MERRRAWRSDSFRAMKRWSTPTPRSKPSRTTYPTIMTATSQNQMNPICVLLSLARLHSGSVDRLSGGNVRFRSVMDFSIHEHGEQKSEQGVESHETEKGK